VQRENRRLAAIVAANVAGYSRLIGQDEEGALRALRLHRKDLIDRLIEEHGDRIANTAGDSLLLEFPSAVDAVRCAVAMQDGMAARNQDIEEVRQVRFRVGIHVGDVVAQRIDQAIRRNPHYPSFYGSILARIHYLPEASSKCRRTPGLSRLPVVFRPDPGGKNSLAAHRAPISVTKPRLGFSARS
jgi:hypothetical protein